MIHPPVDHAATTPWKLCQDTGRYALLVLATPTPGRNAGGDGRKVERVTGGDGGILRVPGPAARVTAPAVIGVCVELKPE